MGKTEDADFHAGVAIVPRKDGVATDGGGGDDEKAAAEGGEDRGQQEMAPFLSLFRFYGPREKAMLATLREDAIEVLQPVQFKNKAAAILAKSYPVLECVAEVMAEVA